MEVKLFEGKPVTFEFVDGQTMINATQMAKAFPGKRVGNFLQNKQTKEFVKLLNLRYSNSSIANNYKALKVVKGGNPKLQGTWMDEHLALDFAAWLSPFFKIWLYDMIKEIANSRKEQYNLEWIITKLEDNTLENYNIIQMFREQKKDLQ